MQPNSSVRILIKAGAVEKGRAYSATRFVGTVEPGQLGIYQGPMTGEMGDQGWHVVSLGAWDVPLHQSQFEPV